MLEQADKIYTCNKLREAWRENTLWNQEAKRSLFLRTAFLKCPLGDAQWGLVMLHF